jgi:hypothetical protein
MTGQGVAELAGDFLALGIAVLGWVVHIRECRGNMAALRDENTRLLAMVERLAERPR